MSLKRRIRDLEQRVPSKEPRHLHLVVVGIHVEEDGRVRLDYGRCQNICLTQDLCENLGMDHENFQCDCSAEYPKYCANWEEYKRAEQEEKRKNF